MPLPSLYVNGQDIEALGMRVETCRGFRDVPVVADPSIAVPGRAGAMRTGASPVMAPREIAITGHVVDAAGTGRTHTDLLAKLESIRALFAIGLLELRTVDLPARAFACRQTRLEFTTVGPEFVAVAATFQLSLRCDDPIAYDVLMSCIGFKGSPVEIPLGTAPSGGIIRIHGPATNPTITYRDLTGVARHSLAFPARALLATDCEEIDLDLMTVRRIQSGVASNDIAALGTNDLENFALSPEDGDALAGAYPTLECSGLTGDGNCELLYWRAWL